MWSLILLISSCTTNIVFQLFDYFWLHLKGDLNLMYWNSHVAGNGIVVCGCTALLLLASFPALSRPVHALYIGIFAIVGYYHFFGLETVSAVKTACEHVYKSTSIPPPLCHISWWPNGSFILETITIALLVVATMSAHSYYEMQKMQRPVMH